MTAQKRQESFGDMMSWLWKQRGIHWYKHRACLCKMDRQIFAWAVILCI